jgi:peroxiredoxin
MTLGTCQPKIQRFMKAARVAILVLLPLGFAIVPPACAQHDVHAALIPKADRKIAPAFHLVGSNGRTVQVSDYHGKVVLLNFWATKCGGCVLEIPYFIEMQKAHEQQGFTAVGISADIPYLGLKSPAEAWQLVRPFVSNHKVNYPVLMGDDATIDAYGFQSYPATYLIDPSGHIAATYVGVVSKDDVEANIKLLLAER